MMELKGGNSQDYVSFVLSVDDLDWTGHWLGGRRCDLIVVFVATGDQVSPSYRLRAVESKAVADTDPITPSLETAPFNSAVDQVVETLEVLWNLMDPDAEHQLVEDLRYASFIEHLMSVALSGLELQEFDKGTIDIMKRISALSLREVHSDDISVDGMVVCTQYRTGVQPKVARIDSGRWPLTLVRAGADDLASLVGSDEALWEILEEEKDAEIVGRRDEESDKVPESELEIEEPEAKGVSEGEAKSGEPLNAEPAGRAEEVALAEDLYAACRQREIPVEAPDHEHITVGPALIAIPMALESGASKRPIENAEEDLAREVGVETLSVENDPERPFHVRFVVARREREFVGLPDECPALVAEKREDYLGLLLGVELGGGYHRSFVSGWPHMLIGGSTGSGKTTFLRSLIKQLGQLPSEFLDIVVIDGKAEVDYLGLLDEEHFASEYPEVLMGAERSLEVLEWLVEQEIPRRRQILRDRVDMDSQAGSARGARGLYVEAARKKELDPFPPIVMILDEFSELMLRGGSQANNFEEMVQQVAQAGRSTLVHLLLATQRPAASVVKGAIKANLDARVALRVPTHHDSMTILGGKGADQLLGNGDLLFQKAGRQPLRLQGFNA